MDNGQRAGVLLVVGGAEFFVGMTLAEALHPGYRISDNSISSLGVGPASLVFNSSAILLGALIILCALFLYLDFHRLLLVAFLVLSGIGAVGVGVIPETAGLPHGLAAGIAFFFGAVSAIASVTSTKTLLRYISLIMGVLALVALALFATGNFLGLGYGGMERLVLTPVLVWVLAFGGYLLRPSVP